MSDERIRFLRKKGFTLVEPPIHQLDGISLWACLRFVMSFHFLSSNSTFSFVIFVLFLPSNLLFSLCVHCKLAGHTPYILVIVEIGASDDSLHTPA